MDNYILTYIIFLPLLGALVLSIFPFKEFVVKIISFIISVIVFILIAYICISYTHLDYIALSQKIPFIKYFNIYYHVGIDGFSLSILAIVAILFPLGYIFMWNKEFKKSDNGGYWASILLIQSGVTGALLSLDLVFFYAFWELMLIPIFIMLGVYGGKDRAYSAMKMTIYTFVGSFLMLACIIYLSILSYNQFGTLTFEIADLSRLHLTHHQEFLFFLGFLLAFAIKIPIFPLHTWIMSAYSNAPTGCVFLLSSLVAKVGVYALVRFLISLFPNMFFSLSLFLVVLSLVGFLYLGVAAIMQKNIKTMFAYSSASHLNFICAGVFALNIYSLSGAFYMIFAHALAFGMLFLMIGILEDNLGTVKFDNLGGIAKRAPIFSIFFMIAVLSSVGVPGTVGFISELLVIIGIYKFNAILGFISVLTLIVGPSYMLWVLQRVIFQTVSPATQNMIDLSKKQIFSLLPLAFLIILLGFFPQIFLNKIDFNVANYIANVISMGIR